MDLFTINRIHKKGDYERAEKLYLEHALSHPDCGFTQALLGTLYIQRGLFGMALDRCRKALAINPDFEECHGDMIVALRRLGRAEEALAIAQDAVFRFGERWERLRRKGKFEGAAAQIAANVLNNFGATLMELARFDEAEIALDRAIEYIPDHVDAHWNRGLVQLSQGNWEGWCGYEFGFRSGERKVRPYFDEAENWHGQTLAGKTLLVWGEQGIGDEILFAQCLPDVQKLAAKVIVDCHPRLEAVFRRSFPGIEFAGKRKDFSPGLFDATPVDYQSPMGSLPLFFRNADDQFTGAPYLKARPDEVAAWREKAPGFRIGLAWRGGSSRTGQRKRSMLLEQLLSEWHALDEAARQDVQLIALQYGEGVFEECDAVQKMTGQRVHCYEGANEDFEQHVDLTASCDLILSVVQTTVHLGGALGVPTLCLVPFGPPWKFPKGDRTPWHGSVEQFHQARLYDWHGPLASAYGVLQRVLTERQQAAA